MRLSQQLLLLCLLLVGARIEAGDSGTTTGAVLRDQTTEVLCPLSDSYGGFFAILLELEGSDNQPAGHPRNLLLGLGQVTHPT